MNEQQNEKENKKGFPKGKGFSKKQGKGSQNKRPKDNPGDECPSKENNRKKPYQDVEWYEINDTISRAVGSLPFNRFPGMREQIVNPDSSLTSHKVTNSSTNSTPGVFQIFYGITPGYSGTTGSAINVAARSLYSWVRHRNSGHSNYESADLMMYIMAMDEIYTAWLEAKRIYKTAVTYKVMNRNIPDLLLRAMGADGNDIRANLANFRAKLNLLAAKISSMAVPNIFKVFLRHAYLAQTVAVDSTSETSQFYVYTRGLERYFDPTQTGGGALIARQPSVWNTATPRTAASIIAEIEYLLNQVITDEDMNIMSGDILKAFGAENLYILKEVDEYEPQEFVYDENILGQIENSLDVPGGWQVSDFDIGQVNNMIGCTGPVYDYNTDNGAYEYFAVYSGTPYFNSHKDDPDYRDCIEWSRNTTGLLNMSGNKFFVTFGSEVILSYRIHEYAYDTAGTQTVTTSGYHSVMTTNNLTHKMLTSLEKFDWHPAIYVFNQTTSSGVTTCDYVGVHIDLKRYTLFDKNNRNELHDACVMGEYGALMLEKLKQAKQNG